MLRLASTREEVSVVADQQGTPTNALDIADAAITVAKNLRTQPTANMRGVFHMTSSGEASWADFAEAIFAASREVGGPIARVIRIPSSAYPTPAKRPASSRLDSSRLAEIHAVRLPRWQDTLPSTIARLVAQEFQGKASS
jgi:dTDP-4-dehydrorhamnose reductase